jgi:hypothetical protein
MRCDTFCAILSQTHPVTLTECHKSLSPDETGLRRKLVCWSRNASFCRGRWGRRPAPKGSINYAKSCLFAYFWAPLFVLIFSLPIQFLKPTFSSIFINFARTYTYLCTFSHTFGTYWPSCI